MTKVLHRVQHYLICGLGWATSVTPHSTASDPAEWEALRCLEQGTAKLEEGDVEAARSFYERSVEIKRTASSLFNLGVTHYHLSVSQSVNLDYAVYSLSPQNNMMKLSRHGRNQSLCSLRVRMLILVGHFVVFSECCQRSYTSDLASAYIVSPSTCLAH